MTRERPTAQGLRLVSCLSVHSPHIEMSKSEGMIEFLVWLTGRAIQKETTCISFRSLNSYTVTRFCMESPRDEF